MISHLGDDFVELLLDRPDQRFDARPHSSPPHQQELPLRDEHRDHDRQPHNASESAPPSQDTGELGEHGLWKIARLRGLTTAICNPAY